MEKDNEIHFLPKPNFNKNLIKSYKTNEKPSFYTNLFKLTLTHPIKINQYPYIILPEIGVEDRKKRRIIFRRIYHEVKETFGNFYQSGDSIYSSLKIEYSKKIRTSLIDRETNKMIEYEITFEAYSNKRETELTNNTIKNSPLCKNLLELIINDILSVNPNVSFYRDLIVNENENVVRYLPRDTKKFKLYPGYLKNIVIYDNICYLNVNLKNRIVSRRSILEMINEFSHNGVINNEYKKYLQKHLEGKSFKGNFSKKNYKIYQLNFDRNPQNTQINYDGRTVNLIQYYKTAHHLTEQIVINQPIIVVKRNIKSEYAQYFVPQLSYLCAIPEWMMQDGNFSKELTQLTKFSPKERIEKINNFLDLLHCTLHKTITVEENGQQIQRNLPSSEELFSNKYGLKIDLPNEKLEGIYINTPEFLVDGTNTIKNLKSLTKIRDSIPMNRYLLIYSERNRKLAYIVTENLQKAGVKLNINICIPDDDDCIEIDEKNSKNIETWISSAEKYYKDYDFVLFLIDNNKESFYSQLKINSLCEVGYISQVIRLDKLKKKNLNNLSIYSKILLQLNSKLGGLTYTINFKKENKSNKTIVIGVDSSHIQGHRTGVAMVASDNFGFNYCSEYIIEEENVENIQFKIASFLNNVIFKYKEKKKDLPNQIIIYRQGVSKEQKQILKNEINQIDDFLNGRKKEYFPLKNKIPYYYILVNKKTSWKFFEVEKKEYYNPNEGLLIYDEITNPDIFEFYIQPQFVQSGSATPTCFHVAYGNLNQPEFIMKYTYDLCYLYPNWTGAVRVPHVLKAAEKLSIMTAKYTNQELIENVNDDKLTFL